MRMSLIAALSLALPSLCPAEGPAGPLAEHRWKHRPILVFADDPSDPRLAEQMERFGATQAALRERDTVVIVDTEPGSDLRGRFAPAEFTVILVGKDGGEKFRRNGLVEPDTLHGLIDTMPMRRREMRGQEPGGEG